MNPEPREAGMGGRGDATVHDAQRHYWWCEREQMPYTMAEARAFDWLVKPEAIFVLCPTCGDALLRMEAS